MADPNSEDLDSSSSSEADPVHSWTIDSMLALYSKTISRVLDAERTHPIWAPVEMHDGQLAWAREDISRLKDLRIPQTPSRQNPDMLLYQLGNLETLDPSFAQRIADALAGDDHIYLSNASGTGKTRLVFEVLARHWGLYFTCTADNATDPYGSSDLSKVFSDISNVTFAGSGFSDNIPIPTRARRWLDALQENRRIARGLLRRLVLSRLLMLQEFCKLIDARHIPESDARMAWLLIQLRPAVLLGDDLFKNTFIFVRKLADDDVSKLMETLLRSLRPKLSFIAVDEAQIGLNVFRAAFASANNRQRAPILRELIVCLGEVCPTARLIISSVQLDMPVVSEALVAGRFRRTALRHYHSLGQFDSVHRSSSYLRHFLGAVSDSDCQTVYQWLHGRHRTIAVLVMLTLRFGAGNIIRVMDTLLYRLAGYQRPDARLLNHHVLHSLRAAINDEHAEESRARLVLRKAVMNFVVHRRTTTTDSHTLLLVRTAVALYGDSASSAVIFEPVILLNLARWLATSAQCGIHEIILRRMVDDGAYLLRSAAFVEGLVPCLWDAVRTAAPIRELFSFPGRQPPWVRYPAEFVLPRLGKTSAMCPVPIAAGPAMRVASTANDVIAWLNEASDPFLIPDRDMGADLLFMLQLHGSRNALVCVHADIVKSTRPRRDVRVNPPNPADFYKDHPDARSRFIETLESLPRMLLDDGSTVGHSRTQPRVAKFNTLHLLCFDEPFRRGTAYDPPVANIAFPYLLRLPRPIEFTWAQVHDTVVHGP